MAKAFNNVSTKYETYNPYKSANAKELNTIRRTLAKRANQRLVRLERAYSSITGESYATYGAIDYAREYLQKIGRNRFSEKKDYTDDFNLLRIEILQLQKFLSSKSSTVLGQREIEQKRIKSFESKGIRFSGNKEFYDFLNSKDYSDLTKQFDSDKIVEYYDLARENMSDDQARRILSKAVDDMRSKENYSLKDLQRELHII